jgi:hypothetical protein
MAQPLPDMNAVEAGEVVDAMFESDDESDVTSLSEGAPYHIPVNINEYTNYHLADLVPNVVYYEAVQNPDGSYYYINNAFKGIERGGNVVYENKHGDNLNIEVRPQTVIFLKAYDLHKEEYDKTKTSETEFLAVSGLDDPLTDLDEFGSSVSSDDMDGGRRRKKSLKKFHFSSTQKHQHGGKKVVRNVTIRHGKGHKKVTYYKGNKKISTVKKPLKSFEIELIKIGKFIPGLFKDCGCGKKRRTRKNKRSRK